jgi:hypothetical protein
VAVEAELLELMQATIRLAPPASRNVAGEWTYGTSFAVRCHLTYSTRTTGGGSPGAGHARVQDATATLDTVYEVNSDWQVTLPTGSPLQGKPVVITGVQQNYDENGPYNTVLTIGPAAN